MPHTDRLKAVPAAARFPAIDLPAALTALLAQVPRGRVTTFGALARALGDHRAAVWVAQSLLRHRHDDRCRCHRVVRADGQVPHSPRMQSPEARLRLARERVAIAGDRVDLTRYAVAELQGLRPLVRLQRHQEQLANRVVLTRLPRRPRTVGGVDLSYRGSMAVAAYTLVDASSGELLWSLRHEQPIDFPYIPGYLSFRELPPLLALLGQVAAQQRQADVLLVDGTGLLHPRRLGIASHLGVLLDWPTIGVAKKLLAGRVLDAAAATVGDKGEQLGWILAPRPGLSRRLYVSPGHRVDLPTARRVVEQMLAGRLLPEPLYWADRLSRTAARRGAAHD